MTPSFPIGNYSVELIWYFHHKDVVDVQLPALLWSVSSWSRQVWECLLKTLGFIFWQHVLLEEHGTCFHEPKHAVLARL